ncbi:MAG: sigma-E processing peptidase SpoIIGA [Oscillospiraceae bacterium]|nr:sigma-E processing peptidase SpoIIGA [Oscillospiraceae bacterium]
MREVIYIDVLLALNIFVTYLLLAATVLLSAVQTKRWRLLCGALLGGAAALLIFLPPLHWTLQALIRLALAAAIVWVAFGWGNWRRALRCYAAFFGMNFALAGSMLALWLTLRPVGMLMQNGVVYFNVSLITFVLLACVSYAAMRGAVILLRRRHPGNNACTATICVDGQSITLPALYDSGNKLTDGFTGAPVVVVEYQALRTFLPAELHEYFTAELDLPPEHDWRTRLRKIPYHAVGHSGLLPAFRSDKITVKSGTKEQTTPNAIVAVTTENLGDGTVHAILQATMLEH